MHLHQEAARALSGDMVMGEIEHQNRALRTAGREPIAIELADVPYVAYAARAGGDSSTLTIRYFDAAVDVINLPIRRTGPGQSIRVLSN